VIKVCETLNACGWCRGASWSARWPDADAALDESWASWTGPAAAR